MNPPAVGRGPALSEILPESTGAEKRVLTVLSVVTNPGRPAMFSFNLYAGGEVRPARLGYAPWIPAGATLVLLGTTSYPRCRTLHATPTSPSSTEPESSP